MIDILFNCFNSLNFYLILFIGFILYSINEKSKQYKSKKEEVIIDSIGRRSEDCPQQYPNAWLPVYDSNNLKKGEVKPIFALGRDLVIYRGTSGKVYVFDAYCPHLGANLGVGGTVVGDDIKCHFHGWQFNNQGDCIAIPGLEDKSIPKATIRKWRCDEVNRMIYVWHHLEGKEPDWFIPKSDQLEKLVYSGENQFKIFCHIQDIMENETDLIHFETIHPPHIVIPKFLRNIIKAETVANSWKGCDSPNTKFSDFELIWSLSIFGLNFARITSYTLTIGPAIYITTIVIDMGIKFNLINTIDIITLGHLRQLGVFKVYSEQSILSFIISKWFLQSMDLLVNLDMVVWNRKRFQRNRVLTKLDEQQARARRWYNQFNSDQSVGPTKVEVCDSSEDSSPPNKEAFKGKELS